MKFYLSILCSVGLLPLTVMAQEDAELKQVLATHEQQRREAESAQLATYADQLEKLRHTLIGQGKTADEKKVKAEFFAVMEKINAINSAAEAAISPDKQLLEHDGENELEAIFASEEPTKPVAKPTSQILRTRDAIATPEGKITRDFWATPSASLRWTLTDLAPGKYRVRLMYRAAVSEHGGEGALEISGNSTPIPFKIVGQSEDDKEVHRLDIAKLDIEKCPVDLIIHGKSLTYAGKPLFELMSVGLYPEPIAKDDSKKPTEPEKPMPEGKKVDF